MNNLSILIPFNSDQGQRERIFHWTLAFYKKYFPEAEICVGSSTSKLFSRSAAINRAADQSTRDLFLITDSDLIFDPQIIQASINLLSKHSWVVPYYSIHYITEESTEQLLTTPPQWPLAIPVHAEIAHWYRDGVTGGIGMIPRKHFMNVGGFDERFMGWGGEDDAFAIALNTLCGKYTRLHSQMYHLWHPSLRFSGNPNYANNLKLKEKYKQSDGNSEAIKKLIRRAARP